MHLLPVGERKRRAARVVDVAAAVDGKVLERAGEIKCV